MLEACVVCLEHQIGLAALQDPIVSREHYPSPPLSPQPLQSSLPPLPPFAVLHPSHTYYQFTALHFSSVTVNPIKIKSRLLQIYFFPTSLPFPPQLAGSAQLLQILSPATSQSVETKPKLVAKSDGRKFSV